MADEPTVLDGQTRSARQPNLTPEQFRDAAMQLSPEVRATAIGMIQVVEAMDRMTGRERLDILDYLQTRYVEQSPRTVVAGGFGHD